MTQTQTVLVRIKPYNRRAGHVLRQLTFQGFKYQERAGWYAVPTALARKLAEVPMRSNDPYGMRAFDIATEDEAQRIDEYEAEQKVRAGARRPHVIVDSTGAPRRVAPREMPKALQPALPASVAQAPLAEPGDLTTADLRPAARIDPEPATEPVRTEPFDVLSEENVYEDGGPTGRPVPVGRFAGVPETDPHSPPGADIEGTAKAPVAGPGVQVTAQAAPKTQHVPARPNPGEMEVDVATARVPGTPGVRTPAASAEPGAAPVAPPTKSRGKRRRKKE